MADPKPTEAPASIDEHAPSVSPAQKEVHFLPNALKTGHHSIDVEHAHLLACVHALRDLCHEFSDKKNCSCCAEGKRKSCEQRLVSLLGDLMGFLLDHFRHEEQQMRDSLFLVVDREVCEAHMEDHANISAKVQQIILVLEPARTVSLLRELDVLLHRWLSSHIMLHDAALGRWLASRGGEFNFG